MYRILYLFFGILCFQNHILISETSLIHIFGDSHSREFKHINKCVVHHLGPYTMYRMGRDGLSFLNIKDYGVRDNDAVVFAFGEIDVRCHIGKQGFLQNRDIETIIEELASNYIQTILDNKAQFENLICLIYSVTPPTDIRNNPSFPIYGPIDQRIFITKKLNENLEQKCKEYDLYFIDVYEDYSDSRGILRVELSDGDVHIHPLQYKYIEEELYLLLTLASFKF